MKDQFYQGQQQVLRGAIHKLMQLGQGGWSVIVGNTQHVAREKRQRQGRILGGQPQSHRPLLDVSSNESQGPSRAAESIEGRARGRQPHTIRVGFDQKNPEVVP